MKRRYILPLTQLLTNCCQQRRREEQSRDERPVVALDVLVVDVVGTEVHI